MGKLMTRCTYMYIGIYMCVFVHTTHSHAHNKLPMQHTNLQQRAALVLAHEAMRSLAAGKRTRGALVTGVQAQASTAATTKESHTMSQGVDSIQQATSVALDFCYRFFGVPIFSDNRCIVFCGSLASLCGCLDVIKNASGECSAQCAPRSPAWAKALPLLVLGGRRLWRWPCHSLSPPLAQYGLSFP
jgi:hypothetical protein